MFIVALRTNRHRFLKQLRIPYDESLNRFMGLESQRKLRYADDTPWTTASPEGFYYTMYPLYDWKARDIWIYNARTRAIYNPLYDLMYRAGVPLRNMRVCEPFGPDSVRDFGFTMSVEAMIGQLNWQWKETANGTGIAFWTRITAAAGMSTYPG